MDGKDYYNAFSLGIWCCQILGAISSIFTYSNRFLNNSSNRKKLTSLMGCMWPCGSVRTNLSGCWARWSHFHPAEPLVGKHLGGHMGIDVSVAWGTVLLDKCYTPSWANPQDARSQGPFPGRADPCCFHALPLKFNEAQKSRCLCKSLKKFPTSTQGTSNPMAFEMR